ncbi:hypothetical protein F66182_8653 [Fusarium sp. NRRL 66182]|nr:hypothetical protein F66182_8653 [Fusarium sp. NRRL 66182]
MAGLVELGQHLLEHGPRKSLQTARRIRAIHNHVVVNSKLVDKQNISVELKERAAVAELVVMAHDGLEEARVDRVLRFFQDVTLGPLSDLVRIEFRSIDQWLEEDDPIFVHPKDPFKRVDILRSQRPVEVKVKGKTVARTTSSMHLYETGLPTRYYLPLASVDQSILRKSDLRTRCPYKGEAEYYNLVVDGEEFENLVWYYNRPTHESAAIAGLVCFYNEKVDTVLDGELQIQPKTHFA